MQKLEEMAGRISKLMNKALNPNSDSDRLYIPRKKRGQGLMIVVVVSLVVLGLENYIKNSH